MLIVGGHVGRHVKHLAVGDGGQANARGVEDGAEALLLEEGAADTTEPSQTSVTLRSVRRYTQNLIIQSDYETKNHII